MKRISILLVIIVLLGFFCVGDVHAGGPIKGFSLKLAGGSGTFSGGDMNDFFSDFNLQAERTAELLGLALDGTIEDLNWGPEFEVEFIAHLSKNLALGLGVGYIYRKNESAVELNILNVFSQSVMVNPKLTAVPITLNVYYNLPVATNLDIIAKAGLGYYFGSGQYEIREESHLLGLTSYWEIDAGTATSKGFGFQGGIGIEYKLSKSVALILEGNGRYANLDGWKGENKFTNSTGQSSTESVDWFYFEELDDVTGSYYRNLFISETAPGGPGTRNVRQANISYSGISLRLGIKISFGNDNV
jgi:opacity protein-like surface antigen